MDEKFRVVITDFITDDLVPEREILGDIADIIPVNAFSEEELEGKIEDADGIMVYHSLELTAKSINRLERCKVIVRPGVGVDNVDHVTARSRGIPVANVPDYGTEEVADSAIGLTLSLTRGITTLNSLLRDNPTIAWKQTHVEPLPRLRGRGFGIIGLGRIGMATAVRAKALGMDVLFYDPHREDGYDKALGVRRVETLDELLNQSFVVSPHCPLTEETHHIINAETIAKMPAGSYLVNTSRGGVVDTSALPDALASGHLAGAGIDVLVLEPPRPDDPLLKAWRDPAHPAHHRLIVNPHSAFYCAEGMIDMRTKGAIACRRGLLGEPIRTLVN